MAQGEQGDTLDLRPPPAWKLGLALVMLAFAGLGQTNAYAGTGTMAPIYDPYSNMNLVLVGSTSTSSTWTNAQAQAQALGGNLVTIHSAAENQFVTNTFFTNLTSQGGPDLSTAYVLWMGLYDPTGAISDDGSRHAADFVWVDGETSAYRNWSGGEPNDGNGGPHEYYGGIWGPDASVLTQGGAPSPLGSWNDLPNLYPGPVVPSQGFYGVAEVPVPEASLMGWLMPLTALFIALLARRRRPLPGDARREADFVELIC